MDFVIVSTADWDNPFWTNKQHVANTLAKMGHRVLYIDSLGLRKPAAKKGDILRIKRRIGKIISGLQNPRENLWVMSPFSIPWHKYNIVRELNEKILIQMIRKYIAKLNFKDVVLWTYNPMTSYLVGKLGERCCVYHCVDDISAQPGMPKKVIQQEEVKLLKAADIVFTTAITLQQEKSKYNKNTYYFSNVADYDHFHKAVTKKYTRPGDMPNDGKPILGFIGAISGYKLDFSLLTYVAEKCPQYNIVLIGKVGEGDPYTDASNLSKYKNIYLLGPKSYEKLPRYLAFFDVALLPCKINEYTKHMFPMKFFEYLAAGRKVVSTALPSLAEYEAVCMLSEGKEEFTENIKISLKNHLQGYADKVARTKTYETRMKAMFDLLNSRM